MDTPTTTHAAGQVFTVQEVLTKAVATAKKYWMQYFILTVGIVVIAIAINLLGVFSSSDVWNFLVQLISIAFSVVASIAMIRLSLLAVNGADPKGIDYMSLVSRDWKMVLMVLGTQILYGIAVFAGLIFFIVPGILFAIIFVFAPYLAVDKGLNPLEAMQASYRMGQGNFLQVFLFGVACFAIQFAFIILPLLFLLLIGLMVGEDGAIALVIVAILALIPMAVISFIIKMIGGFGLAYMYQKLVHARPEALKF